uniref:Uncharacterized protein n=1 Tax=Panagrolaimus superbus TaxID=310955 RepID=A0A914YBY7_9BILA
MIEAVPNSVINPFVNDELGKETACYDIDGFPTKDVLGQTICLLTVKMTCMGEYIYIGPLLGNSMITFNDESYNYKFANNCFSTGNTSHFVNNDGYCAYENKNSSSKLQCCFTQTQSHSLKLKLESDAKNMDKQKLLCIPGKMEENITITEKLSLKEYTEKYINYACSVTLLIEVVKDATEMSFSATFGSLDNDCNDETTLLSGSINNTYDTDNVDNPYFCSSSVESKFFVAKLKMIKCCKDEHFCNQKLIPLQIYSLKCEFGTPLSYLLSGTLLCEYFFDIKQNENLQIVLGYNAIKPEQKM